MSKSEIERTLKILTEPENAREYLQTDIFVLDTKDNSVRRITDSPAEEESPAISDDGKTVVFCWGGLYTLHISTMKYTRIANDDMGCKESRWIPNAKQVSFIGQPETQKSESSQAWTRDIFVVGSDGAGLENLTRSPRIDEYGHDWSPDGQRFAYVQKHLGENRNTICIQDRVGSGGQQIYDAPPNTAQIVWGSEDNRLYYSYREGKAEFRMRAIDTNTGQYEEFPVGLIGRNNWCVSREGDKLVCSGSPQGQALSSADAPFSARVTVDGMSPLWSNNGRFVVYARKSLPEGLLDHVKRGKSPNKYVMIVLKKDGAIDFDTDVLNIYSPVVEEVEGSNAEKEIVEFKNLSKKEAEALLSRKSLDERFDLDLYEWGKD